MQLITEDKRRTVLSQGGRCSTWCFEEGSTVQSFSKHEIKDLKKNETMVQLGIRTRYSRKNILPEVKEKSLMHRLPPKKTSSSDVDREKIAPSLKTVIKNDYNRNDDIQLIAHPRKGITQRQSNRPTA